MLVGGNHAGGVAGVYTGIFDMLHDGRHKGVRSVGYGVSLRFNGVS
jgi:hypothetical protein